MAIARAVLIASLAFLDRIMVCSFPVELNESLKFRRLTKQLSCCRDESIDLLIAEVKIGAYTVEEIPFAVITNLRETDINKVKGDRALRC